MPIDFFSIVNFKNNVHRQIVSEKNNIGRKARAADGGALEDVAPTLLKMMGLPQPAEMTGKPLLAFV